MKRGIKREGERERTWECDVGERKFNKNYQNIFSTYNRIILLLDQLVANAKFIWHLTHLMKVIFCVWCVKC